MAASVGEGSGGTTNWGLSFSYDVYGNRMAQTVTAGSAPAFSASFGSNNRMVGYSYDNNGNQLNAADGATLEYDPDNRLTKWTKQGQTDQYQYHPSGWRLSKGSEKYLYGPGGQLLESYRAWNDITDYVYFGGRLLYTLSAGQAVTRIYSDRLGSTRATETIEQYGGGWTTRNYYPFGEEITSTSNDQYKFASTYRDSATGLDYAVNRYYASGMGRFLTTDPAKRSARLRKSGSWNRYTYGSNDPINHSDPLGLFTYEPVPCWWFGDCDPEPEPDPEPDLVPPDPSGGTDDPASPTKQSVRVRGNFSEAFRNGTRNAISQLSEGCQGFFKSLEGGMQALTDSVDQLEFFDTDQGGLNASAVLPGTGTQTLSQYVGSSGAAVLANASGISNGIVIGYVASTPGLNVNMMLVHEAAHYAYQMYDENFRERIRNDYGFDPAKHGKTNVTNSSEYFTAFLLSGCPKDK